MEAFLHSTLLVTVGEMGDKTQLLALVLAARFGRPWVIMGGILVATLLNHALAATVGGWVATMLPADVLKWCLAGLFWIFALWMLIPDKIDESTKTEGAGGAFLTTFVAFFLAEMGDKTQLATVALGARFSETILVVLGTTLGMLIADGLAVFAGEKLRLSVSSFWIRGVAFLLFVLSGLAVIYAL